MKYQIIIMLVKIIALPIYSIYAKNSIYMNIAILC